jgi:hypothetical protein
MHLIDKHMFPKDYDFYVVNDGIDQRSSMLRSGRNRRRSFAAQHKTEIEERTRRRASVQKSTTEYDSKAGSSRNIDSYEAPQSGGPDAEETEVPRGSQPDTEMDDLSGAMSALKFIPASVRFGRGKGKGGFSRS